MSRDDGDRPERIEYDPRWEVQPEPVRGHDPANALRTIAIAILALLVFAAILVWLVSMAPPTT